MGRYSEISPEGGYVDFYRFHANAGDIPALEVVRGALDSTMGVFDADSGELLATNDDGGAGLLSRLLLQANLDLNLAVAVSALPDLEFNGRGEDFGRYVLSVREYRGTVVPAGDDTSTIVPLTGFNFPAEPTCRGSHCCVNEVLLISSSCRRIRLISPGAAYSSSGHESWIRTLEGIGGEPTVRRLFCGS